jgi:hypothetical protein
VTPPSGGSRRVAALTTGLVAAAVTAGVAIWLHASGKAVAPGFLGPGKLVADVNLVLEVLLVLGLTFGFFFARTGRIEAHRVNQTTWVMVNAALVATIMVASLADVKPTSVADMADPRLWVTWLHALIGTLAAAAGLWIVLQMNDVLPRRMHVRGWKNLMRATLAAYWLVALLGFATYYFYYVA